jgi:hypothetical protein
MCIVALLRACPAPMLVALDRTSIGELEAEVEIVAFSLGTVAVPPAEPLAPRGELLHLQRVLVARFDLAVAVAEEEETMVSEPLLQEEVRAWVVSALSSSAQHCPSLYQQCPPPGCERAVKTGMPLHFVHKPPGDLEPGFLEWVGHSPPPAARSPRSKRVGTSAQHESHDGCDDHVQRPSLDRAHVAHRVARLSTNISHAFWCSPCKLLSS